MKGKKYAGGGVKLLTAILFTLLIAANALAENPDALLSKESSKQMFALSRLVWEENARQVKAAGVGDFIDDDLSLFNCREPFGVEDFSSERSIEPFIVTVLPRTAGIDLYRLDPNLFKPDL